MSHHWLVDVEARTVATYRLEAGRSVELGGGDERDARIEPFADAPLDVASWCR